MLWQGVLIIGADGICQASPSLVDSVLWWEVLIICKEGEELTVCCGGEY